MSPRGRSRRPVPAATAAAIEEAAPYPDFAHYMERCLHDPAFGYYGAGKVAFGRARHFWTFPQRLRPLFGWMLAEVARDVFASLGPVDNELTILELGGGEGELARDTLDYIVGRRRTKEWSPFADRVRYIIAETHAAMRARQRVRLRHYLNSGRAEIRGLDACALDWEGVFHGLVIANELLDALPCERIRLIAPGPIAQRVHVVPIVRAARLAAAGLHAADLIGVPEALRRQMPRGSRGLSEAAFWRLVADEAWSPECTCAELYVPLEHGWRTRNGGVARVPTELSAYLETLAPLVADLDACGLLPVEICWAPGLERLINGVAALTSSGPERRGAALFIDYGGTSRHVLDPRSAGPHFRTYGGLRMHDHVPLPYEHPGARDMTFDIDFTEVTRLANAAGLRLCFFGHQRALEAPPVDLWAPAARELLVRALTIEGEDDPREALATAEELVARFREAPGFRCLALAGAATPWDAGRLGPPDAVNGQGLWTLPHDIDRAWLETLFAARGLPVEAARCLKACGDIVADLSDRRLYRLRHEVLALLRESGCLAPAARSGCKESR